MQIAAIIGGDEERGKVFPITQSWIRSVCVLAHDLLDAVGLDRRQRLVRAVEQGGQPVRQPSRAAIVHLGPKRVEAGGLSSLQRCIAAPIGADRHLHTKSVIKDEDPRACSTGLGHEECGKDGFARSGPSHDQGMAAGRFFVRASLLVIGEPIGALLRRGQHGDHLAPRHVTCLFAELCAVERCKIRKVAVGDGTGAHALGLVAGMLAEVVRLGATRSPIIFTPSAAAALTISALSVCSSSSVSQKMVTTMWCSPKLWRLASRSSAAMSSASMSERAASCDACICRFWRLIRPAMRLELIGVNEWVTIMSTGRLSMSNIVQDVASEYSPMVKLLP